MTIKKVDEKNKIVNTTQTELDVLKKLEQAFYKNNPEAARRNTEKSLDWFRKYIPRAWNEVRTSQMMRDRSLWKNDITPGSMYLALYDPIHKDTLPVYDKFPLLLPWDTWVNEKNGKRYIISINLHYLPPALRAAALTQLLKLRTDKRYRKNTKIKLSWGILKALSNHKLFEHCVKMYRIDHFKSVFIEIPVTSWEMVTFLPLARWEKGGKAVAWNIK